MVLYRAKPKINFEDEDEENWGLNQNSQSKQRFNKSVTKIMSNPETLKMLMKVGIKKVLTLARTISI